MRSRPSAGSSPSRASASGAGGAHGADPRTTGRDAGAGPQRCSIRFRVSPGAKADRVSGLKGDEIAVSLKAPPVDGRANAALVKFLARILGVKAGDLAIATGLAGRSKTVKIDGLGREAAEGRLLADLAPAEAPAGGGPLEAGPEACGRRRRGR